MRRLIAVPWMAGWNDSACGSPSRTTATQSRREQPMAITSRTKRILGLVATLSMAGSLLIAAPVAAAAAPQPVTINLVWTFPGEGIPPTGVFVTTNGSDMICASGTSVWASFQGHGWPSHVGALEVRLTEQFTCDDGSGTFLLREQYHFNPVHDPATWIVLSGTGRYANLIGRGSAVSGDNGAAVLTGFLIG